MIEKPAQAREGNLLVDRLKDIEKAADRLVIGCVQAKWPAILHEKLYNLRQFFFERDGKIRARLQEILEVRCREHEHFAGAVHAIEIASLSGPGHRHPFGKIVQLVPR